MIQARRCKLTIGEYVATVLARHVPDHRTIRADPQADAGAAQGRGEADGREEFLRNVLYHRCVV